MTEVLARTARVITAAALVTVAVFGAFALSPNVSLKLIGLGLAAAILIDATVAPAPAPEGFRAARAIP